MEQPVKENETLAWRAAEYQFVKKGPAWYLIISLIGLFLLFVAFKQKNFFFGLFILIALAVIFYFSRHRPPVLDFAIDAEGIKIGKSTAFRYDQLEKFATRQRPGQLDEIIVKRKTVFNPYTVLPVDSIAAEKAKKILKQKLPSFEYEPSFFDIFTDFMGF